MTPVERHAAALNAINQQIEDARKLIVEAQRVQLALDEPRMLGRYMPGWHSWKDVEKALAAALARLEGCRRILQRHAPELRAFWPRALPDQKQWVCKGCGKPWEDCPDWRDAAGLPGQDTPNDH